MGIAEEEAANAKRLQSFYDGLAGRSFNPMGGGSYVSHSNGLYFGGHTKPASTSSSSSTTTSSWTPSTPSYSAPSYTAPSSIGLGGGVGRSYPRVVDTEFGDSAFTKLRKGLMALVAVIVIGGAIAAASQTSSTPNAGLTYPGYAKVDGTDLNVRSAPDPSRGDNILTTLANGTRVKLLSAPDADGWVQVEGVGPDGQTYDGYARAKSAKLGKTYLVSSDAP